MAPADKRRALQRIVSLYDSWDAAEPGKGYAEKAAEWRGKLETGNKKLETRDETLESQNVETSKDADTATPEIVETPK